jgi:hypothetical protein
LFSTWPLVAAPNSPLPGFHDEGRERDRDGIGRQVRLAKGLSNLLERGIAHEAVGERTHREPVGDCSDGGTTDPGTIDTVGDTHAGRRSAGQRGAAGNEGQRSRGRQAEADAEELAAG